MPYFFVFFRFLWIFARRFRGIPKIPSMNWHFYEVKLKFFKKNFKNTWLFALNVCLEEIRTNFASRGPSVGTIFA